MPKWCCAVSSHAIRHRPGPHADGRHLRRRRTGHRGGVVSASSVVVLVRRGSGRPEPLVAFIAVQKTGEYDGGCFSVCREAGEAFGGVSKLSVVQGWRLSWVRRPDRRRGSPADRDHRPLPAQGYAKTRRGEENGFRRVCFTGRRSAAGSERRIRAPAPVTTSSRQIVPLGARRRRTWSPPRQTPREGGGVRILPIRQCAQLIDTVSIFVDDV